MSQNQVINFGKVNGHLSFDQNDNENGENKHNDAEEFREVDVS